jgi:hypothetical protein
MTNNNNTSREFQRGRTENLAENTKRSRKEKGCMDNFHIA